MILRVASMPPMTGMVTSMSTRSGRSLRACSMASLPLEASPTTSMSGWVPSTTRKPCLTTSWSSARSTLAGAPRAAEEGCPRAPDSLRVLCALLSTIVPHPLARPAVMGQPTDGWCPLRRPPGYPT
ncbi:MAG: hypothetical protein AVDCRST_MAG01-01-1286 [uncultured Rubrobacteraceae bacterium]|uniref:Uncharacterized protein n=1 Tax=uncultured Rubrobacteraceae bacterium TaxID=349277 RepID=A0A6J4P5K4_9ACTN|nr:MAG: hypothetical protein AVDCRST_MAG01-01-1286 [uncultured Rubrobacteraceae bacterium]